MLQCYFEVTLMSISESGFMSVNKTSSPDDASTTLSRE